MKNKFVFVPIQKPQEKEIIDYTDQVDKAVNFVKKLFKLDKQEALVPVLSKEEPPQELEQYNTLDMSNININQLSQNLSFNIDKPRPFFLFFGKRDNRRLEIELEYQRWILEHIETLRQINQSFCELKAEAIYNPRLIENLIRGKEMAAEMDFERACKEHLLALDTIDRERVKLLLDTKKDLAKLKQKKAKIKIIESEASINTAEANEKNANANLTQTKADLNQSKNQTINDYMEKYKESLEFKQFLEYMIVNNEDPTKSAEAIGQMGNKSTKEKREKQHLRRDKAEANKKKAEAQKVKTEADQEKYKFDMRKEHTKEGKHDE